MMLRVLQRSTLPRTWTELVSCAIWASENLEEQF